MPLELTQPTAGALCWLALAVEGWRPAGATWPPAACTAPPHPPTPPHPTHALTHSHPPTHPHPVPQQRGQHRHHQRCATQVPGAAEEGAAGGGGQEAEEPDPGAQQQHGLGVQPGGGWVLRLGAGPPGMPLWSGFIPGPGVSRCQLRWQPTSVAWCQASRVRQPCAMHGCSGRAMLVLERCIRRASPVVTPAQPQAPLLSCPLPAGAPQVPPSWPPPPLAGSARLLPAGRRR